MKTTAKKARARAVLVCTEFRGIFYGHTAAPLDATTATLTGVRNCIYWDRATGGFLGLAETGPSDGCRIGVMAAGPVCLQKITCIAEVTKAAAERWEAAKCVQ